MKRKIVSILVALVLLLGMTAVPALAGPDDDTGTVTNYAINSAIETGAGEVTVNAQAEYCTACNPNTSGASGCTAFLEGPPPWGHKTCTQGYPDGTYIAVRIKDSSASVLAMQKLILQEGVNMTRGSIDNWNFVFSGLPVSAGDTLTVEADTYCSWCGHWYPTAVTLTVSASNSQVTYTGDTSGLVGTNASVSATLIDSSTNAPLVGETIVFTLNGLTPVSGVTNISGVATAVYPIPSSMTGGIYPMEARFAGNASYFGHSDTVDFEVITNQPPTADAGPDQTVEQDSYDGAEVTLDGSKSSDPDGDPLTYLWTWDGESATGVGPTVTLPMGTTTVTLVVSDGTVDSGPDTVDITVEDTTDPSLTVNCVESVNPHGNKIPGENRGKNGKDKKNVNPDGFYELSFIVEDICDSEPKVYIGTEDDPLMFDITAYADGIVIKFTESDDAVPEMKKIGSTNGKADAVTWHIILPTDPVITAIDASGNYVSCKTCLVPPPPM